MGATPPDQRGGVGGWGMIDSITSLMYENSTLIGAIIVIAALAYIGTNGISASNPGLRRLVAYLCGLSQLVIGGFGFYFGASKELTLLYAQVYDFDLFRIEWAFVGAVAIIVGFVLFYQARTRM